MKIQLFPLILTATLWTVLGVASPRAHAQEPAQSPGAMQRLSFQERNEILQIRESANQIFLKKIAQLKNLEAELNQLMISATSSEKDIAAKYRQVQALSQEIMNNEFEAKLKIRSILPPDLRTPFARQLNAALGNASDSQTSRN